MNTVSLFGIFFLVLVTLTLETTFLSYVEISGVKPDLILIAVLYCSILFKPRNAAGIGFFFGLCQDALSVGFFGVNALLKFFTVLGITTLREKYFHENAGVEYLLSLIFIFFNSLIMAMLTFSNGHTAMFLWQKAIVTSLYTFFTLPLFFLFMGVIVSNLENHVRKIFKL